MEIQSKTSFDQSNNQIAGIASQQDQSNSQTSSSENSNSSSSSSSASSSIASSINSSSATNSTTSIELDFLSFMKSALGGESKTQVSEEELYASLLERRIGEKSSEAGTYFAEEKAKLAASQRRADGYLSYEDISIQALNNTVAAGKLSKEEAEMINGEAFSGAQLDDDLSSLFDDRGDTIAVASIEDALAKSKTYMDGITDGSMTAVARSLDLGPTGGGSVGTAAISSNGSSISGSQSLDGGGGFVWKPESDSDGKLVVLIPSTFAGNVERLAIHSALPPTEENKIESGNYKYDSNGGRPTFRFSKPGSSYGDGLHVVAYNKDGSTATWDISNGAERAD